MPTGMELSGPQAHREDPIGPADTIELFQIDDLRSNFLDVMPPVVSPAFQMVTPTEEHFDRVEVAEPIHEAQHNLEPRSYFPSESESTGRPSDAGRITVPTCSLNLVCYRSGGSGCKSHVIRVTKESRYENKSDYTAALAANPSLITSDKDFFIALRASYETIMCGFWRRTFFLKTLRGFRLLSVSLLSSRSVRAVLTYNLSMFKTVGPESSHSTTLSSKKSSTPTTILRRSTPSTNGSIGCSTYDSPRSNTLWNS